MRFRRKPTRLWLVLCIAVLVGLFLAIAYGAIAGQCDTLSVVAQGSWCLPWMVSDMALT